MLWDVVRCCEMLWDVVRCCEHMWIHASHVSTWTGLVRSGNGGVAKAMSVGGDCAASCDWAGEAVRLKTSKFSVEEWLSLSQPNLKSDAHFVYDTQKIQTPRDHAAHAISIYFVFKTDMKTYSAAAMVFQEVWRQIRTNSSFCLFLPLYAKGTDGLSFARLRFELPLHTACHDEAVSTLHHTCHQSAP